jgi:putative acetyltransferase
MIQSLCESCRHVRPVVTPKKSRFLLCQMSATDQSYAKYPPQPVLRCSGYGPRCVVRRFEPRDAEAIARLFHDTIRTVNLGDYTQEQVEAWAPDDIHFRDWVAACGSHYTFVAEQDGMIVGFGELEASGHVDRFYVHHQHQRQGIGQIIYAAVETEAGKLGLRRLFTEASITARPFFARLGYAVLREQTVECRGQTFINYVMEKQIR